MMNNNNSKLFNEETDLCSVMAFELQKLYPNIKIPVDIHAEYYLNQLSKSREFSAIHSTFDSVKEFMTIYGTVGKKGDYSAHEEKMRYVGKMKTLFEEQGWSAKINKTHPNSEFPLVTKKFEPEDGGLYVSIDLRQSNFNVLKMVAGLGVDATATWSDFTTRHFPGMHPALVNSKSYRQMLFGNLNPGRTASLTGGITASYLEIFPGALKVAGVNVDEIIIEVQEEQSLWYVITELSKLPWYKEIPVKFTPFATNFSGEGKNEVRVDTIITLGEDLLYDSSFLKLVGVPGNRFHLNFAKYILEKEELADEDLFFELDGRIAKWID